MGFLKKHLFLIICLLTGAVGAGIFGYGVLVGLANNKERAAVASQCNRTSALRGQVVHDNELRLIEAEALQAKNDANTVLRLARETTQRPLIYADIFPEPKGESVVPKYRGFAEAYCRVVEAYLQRLKAGDRPSSIEVNKVREEFKRSTVTTTRTTSRVGGEAMGGGRSRTSEEDQEIKLLEALRKEKAQACRVYANTDVFAAYEYWKSYEPAARDTILTDSWYTQLADWIQVDVIDSINQVNADANSVIEAPVKRLIEVSFGGKTAGSSETGFGGSRRGGDMGRTAGASGGAGRHQSGSAELLPCYVKGSKAEATSTYQPGGGGSAGGGVTGNLSASWTGHVSDDLVDVVQFELAVVVESQRINDFLNALQREKFTAATADDGASQKLNRRNQITVIQMILEPVDYDAEEEAGYYYGPTSLKVLRLVGEYIFFKSGYEDKMPRVLKESAEAGSSTLR